MEFIAKATYSQKDSTAMQVEALIQVQRCAANPRRAADHKRQDQGEEYHRCAVVEQTLALHQHREPLGCVQSFEQGHHGNRIGGRDERREDQRMLHGEGIDDAQFADRRLKQDRRKTDRGGETTDANGFPHLRACRVSVASPRRGHSSFASLSSA